MVDLDAQGVWEDLKRTLPGFMNMSRARTTQRGGIQQLPAPVLARIIPSTTLLAAIHYRGIENGPTFDFVLRSGLAKDPQESGHETAEDVYEDQHRTEWKLLLGKLGIISSDEYEILVIDYLETGLLDAGSVTSIIDRYVAETGLMELHRRINVFRDHAIWHHYMTDEQIVTEAQDLAAEASWMDANTVTWMHEILKELPGGEKVGDLILNNWLTAFSARPDQRIDGIEYRSRNVHPRIRAELDAIADKIQADTTLYDAIYRISTRNSWGTRETLVLKNATVHDFEVAIRTRDMDEFKLFVPQLIDMCRNHAGYSEHFRAATDHFIEACRKICADPASGRLRELIRLLFEDGKLPPLFEPER